jgi:two-component system response regulator AtoC
MKNAQVVAIRDSVKNRFLTSACAGMRSVEAAMIEVAQTDVPVLFLAEPGAGKKSAAQRIHELSGLGMQPFRTISCATLACGNFSESEPSNMFRGGTAYLEELTDLSREGQACLLKYLIDQNSNGSHSQSFARLICGSARDLESEVKAGNFREDLYYRISGLCLRLPPLRQRRDDIPVLTAYFLRKYAIEFQRLVPDLSGETQHLFREYFWPGNVRELENICKAMVAIGDEAVAMGGLRAMLLRSGRSGNGARVSLKQEARAASREKEKEIILRALTRTRLNRRRAAQELQISYKALLYKLKQIGCSEFEAS